MTLQEMEKLARRVMDVDGRTAAERLVWRTRDAAFIAAVQAELAADAGDDGGPHDVARAIGRVSMRVDSTERWRAAGVKKPGGRRVMRSWKARS